MSSSEPVKPTYQTLLAENEALSVENEKLKAQILVHTHELARLKKLIRGAKSERFIPAENAAQLTLPTFAGEDRATSAVATEEITYKRKKSKQIFTPHGRNPLPAHLPRKEIVIEPDGDTTRMKKIGEEVTEELDYEPGKLYVNRYVRPKYARNGGDGVVIGSLPTRPIEKGMAGPGLLAHLAIGKYVDHLPLYRQRKQFLRHDIKLPASTLGDWLRSTCKLLEPLYELQRALIQKACYLQTDETSIRVQDSATKGQCHKGYYWVYHDPLDRLVFFDYRDSRSRDGPEKMLGDFSGFLQTDGYAGYDTFGRRNAITHLACFAHARRYFVDAVPNDASNRAEAMLVQIQKLYDVERQARENGASYDERYQLRQAEALPVLSEMKAWLETERQRVLPKSAVGQAIAYMLKFWQRLNVYTTDGRLEIDNNLVENAIRPVALGRKNYLFAGSHDAARRGAIIYSLVVTAQLHDVEPFRYLKDVIARISEHPHKHLAELLPQNWKRTFYADSSNITNQSD
jgi:transposase